MLLDPGGSSSRAEMRARVIHGVRDWENLSQRILTERYRPPNLCCGVKELPKFRSIVEAGEGEGWDDTPQLEMSKGMFSSSR